MSHTYRDAPGWVRMGKDRARLVREAHDHRWGECTLGDFTGPDSCWYGGEGCGYGPALEYYFGKGSGCPCWMCHDGYGNRVRTRRRRHVETLLCVGLAKCSIADIEEQETGAHFQFGSRAHLE
jgi:hypothetical protein